MESEAYNLVEKAEKKLKTGFLGGLFSSKEGRMEEALELYQKAGNIFKLNKKWVEAGECFEKCGNLEESLKADPTSHFQDASHCYSFMDKRRSYDVLQKCLKIYQNQGRFQMAGKMEKQIAEDFESELKYNESIQSYIKAAEYFSMESLNSKSYEQSCLLKVADLMCENNHPEAYKEAKVIYEKIAMQYLSVPLLKSSAKDLFFKSVVVHLTFDVLIY
jgi:alpha-soluble NSF attachment protein